MAEYSPEQWESWATDARYHRMAARTEMAYKGCWIWKGATNPRGIGLVRDRGRLLQVHRLAWEVMFGEIPEGMVVHRTCYQRACWSPDHLELVTAMEAVHRRRRRNYV